MMMHRIHLTTLLTWLIPSSWKWCEEEDKIGLWLADRILTWQPLYIIGWQNTDMTVIVYDCLTEYCHDSHRIWLADRILTWQPLYMIGLDDSLCVWFAYRILTWQPFRDRLWEVHLEGSHIFLTIYQTFLTKYGRICPFKRNMWTAGWEHFICPSNMGYMLYLGVFLAFKGLFLPERRVLQPL